MIFLPLLIMAVIGVISFSWRLLAGMGDFTPGVVALAMYSVLTTVLCVAMHAAQKEDEDARETD